MTIKLLSINVRALNFPAKHFSLWKEAVKLNANILIAQETHFQKWAALQCQYRVLTFIFSAELSSKKRGVLIAIKNSVTFNLHPFVISADGWYIILVCTINNKIYTIVGAFAPNSKHGTFFCKLFTCIAKHKHGNLIIGGDLNLVNPHLYSTSNRRTCSFSLSNLMHEDVYDVQPCLHASECDYTYHSPMFNSYSRIYIFLVDKWSLKQVSCSDIADITGSDHTAVSITISEQYSCHPILLWCWNNKLVTDQSTKDMLNKHLKDFFATNDAPDVKKNHFGSINAWHSDSLRWKSMT